MGKKILFVYPTSYDSKHRLIKSRMSFIPSRALPYLAALTPKHYETRIVDELVDDLDFDEDVDLVALTGMLRHMPRAIDIAIEFRKRGRPTIIGGVGAFALQDMLEKKDAFDSFIIGEVDELWESILHDFEIGHLKRRYECNNPPQLDGLPAGRFDLLNRGKYIRSFLNLRDLVIPVETSRGCPHNCRFCLVTRYFGKKMRYRPIGEVVDEVKYHGVKYVLFTDDNIAINSARARELFLAIKPLGIQWFGQFEARVIENPELLRLAANSGCRTAVVGVESLLRDNLYSVDKDHSAKVDFKDIANGFEEAGIDLFASLIFGMDNDTPEIINWTIEEMIKSGVDAILPWMLTPIPKTPCYDDYKNEGRLLHENYSLYDFWHLVIQPKSMTPEELEKAYWQGLRRFYSMRLIFLRTLKDKRWMSGGLLYNLFACRQVCNGLHPIAGNTP